MRKPWEVLELALMLLDINERSFYMCCHLEWMAKKEYITDSESIATQQAVRASIKYHTTLCSYLREIIDIPCGMLALHPEFRPYQVKFYTDLVIKLKEGETK